MTAKDGVQQPKPQVRAEGRTLVKVKWNAHVTVKAKNE